MKMLSRSRTPSLFCFLLVTEKLLSISSFGIPSTLFTSSRKTTEFTKLFSTKMSSDEESRFFLDTADIEEWDRFLPTGIFYGITTNPTILERDGHFEKTS